jgi:hypothetical protein
MTDKPKEQTYSDHALELEKLYNEKVNSITELKQQQCDIQARVILGLEDMFLSFKKLTDFKEKYMINMLIEKDKLLKEIGGKYVALNDKHMSLMNTKYQSKLEPINEEPVVDQQREDNLSH